MADFSRFLQVFGVLKMHMAGGWPGTNWTGTDYEYFSLKVDVIWSKMTPHTPTPCTPIVCISAIVELW